MRAYNKRKRPKNHNKPKWVADGRLFLDPITNKIMVEVVQYHLVGYSVYPGRTVRGDYFLVIGSTCKKSKIREHSEQL